jgi:hypothetical protein
MFSLSNSIYVLLAIFHWTTLSALKVKLKLLKYLFNLTKSTCYGISQLLSCKLIFPSTLPGALTSKHRHNLVQQSSDYIRQSDLLCQMESLTRSH